MAPIVNRHYNLVNKEKVDERRQSDDEQMKIKDCMKQHMYAYFPDGSIQVKENMCVCEYCIEGKFILCGKEKGRITEGEVIQGNIDIETEDSPFGEKDDAESNEEMIERNQMLNK